jgi:hypothetical protein
MAPVDDKLATVHSRLSSFARTPWMGVRAGRHARGVVRLSRFAMDLVSDNYHE